MRCPRVGAINRLREQLFVKFNRRQRTQFELQRIGAWVGF